MAENVTLARPYAEAAFRIAREANQLDAWLAALQRMSAVVNNADMRTLLDNPLISASVATNLLLDVAGKDLSTEQQNFARLLAESERLPVLPEICELFAELKNNTEGIKEAEITSAFPIDASALANLVADLERKFQGKVRASVVVDPELIGGVRIAVGDQVIDASVRGKLAQMATALKN